MALIDSEAVVSEAKKYIMETFALSDMTDEELNDAIENVVSDNLRGRYCPIEEKLDIVQQIFSSIRGFGLLDTIMKDETITEVMINGPDNIFIEQKGRLTKLEKGFESERRLEDIIQRIVGKGSQSGKSDM